MRQRDGLTLGVIIGLVVSLIFVAGFGSGILFSRSEPAAVGTSDQNLNDFLTAYRLVTQRYYHPVSHKQLINAAIDGMLTATGDPHTLFLTPSGNQQANQEINGSQYGGIGAIVLPRAGALEILATIPRGPAAGAGLRFGDVVTRIDGKSVSGVSGDAVDSIHGKAGSTVSLTVVRGHRPPFTVRLRRSRIAPISAFGYPLGHHLAYLQILSFGGDTAQEVANALKQDRSLGIRGIVLDLRGNPGGYVDAAQQIVSEFVDHGIVAFEKSARGTLQPVAVIGGRQIVRVPVAVLVDGGTASAAEITAAALRDDSGAVLVGTRTYGKGSMQSVYNLGDGSSIRITDRMWLTPRRKSVQKVGLMPSVTVPYTSSDAAGGTDPQLSAAESVLLRRIG